MSAISKEKVAALARKGHVKCHGRGILGYRPGTNAVVLCTCVWRNLRRQGVNVNNRVEVMKALAVDLPAAEKAGEAAG